MSTTRSTLSHVLSKRAAMQNKVQALEPEKCKTMADVRFGVDSIDTALIELLARRFGYMDAAARIKTDRDTVRDEARKAQVIANAEAVASQVQIPVEPIKEIWDRLVEASIEYELAAWDRLNTNPA
jgi:isochorismate pyruvate lyase